MPRLLIAVLCDDVLIEQGGKHSLMVIFDEFSLTDPTIALPSFRIFALLGMDDPEEHHLVMKFRGADGVPVVEFTGQIQAKTLSEASALYVAPINLGFGGMKLPQPGVYQVAFMLDGIDLGGPAFVVRVVPKPPVSQ